ncbi:hypothetical protein [Nakamurella leprariae]|uniref:Uncharacterized protein n=1 Tax=Nakamurella leprariae TaxID=2803911 RepID=A0A938YCN2_9ACTN|nr:hypothetical protein [Nakamurella leprariae]MBM9467173.1 hypothetical protein [Nakamurella leprariae]
MTEHFTTVSDQEVAAVELPQAIRDRIAAGDTNLSQADVRKAKEAEDIAALTAAVQAEQDRRAAEVARREAIDNGTQAEAALRSADRAAQERCTEALREAFAELAQAHAAAWADTAPARAALTAAGINTLNSASPFRDTTLSRDRPDAIFREIADSIAGRAGNTAAAALARRG